MPNDGGWTGRNVCPFFYLTKKEVSEGQVKKVNVGPEEKYLDR